MLYERFQPLLDHLAVKTGYACELVPGKTYAETIGALGRGELDFAFLGPLSYLEARKKYGARALVRPRGRDGSAVYRSVIITKGESSLRGIGDLKGNDLPSAPGSRRPGNLMPRYLLAASGIHLNDLGGYAYFDYPGSVIKSVLRGDHDAGAIPASSAGEIPQERHQGARGVGAHSDRSSCGRKERA
ncbi:MAG: phosphate/phosphite/phosphonate ABC transporter substrate-binding protein [Comamonadaceae bacterium]|nr:phosphate/phosphite/phosphonate ABC transporter substrate-binding protein [Comamonadaceae bacterium]